MAASLTRATMIRVAEIIGATEVVHGEIALGDELRVTARVVQIGAARASVLTYINPAVASLLGVMVLGEHFGIGATVGLAMILLGSWMGTGGRGGASG